MSEIIYGIHAVKALLERDPQRFLEVFILKGREDRRLQPLIAELEATGIVIQVANRQWLDDKVEGAVHQGIIARVREGTSPSPSRADCRRCWTPIRSSNRC